MAVNATVRAGFGALDQGRSEPIVWPRGQTQPVGLGSPAILQACLAGP